MSGTEKLQCRNLTIECPAVNYSTKKKINGVSFNSNGKISMSKKSDETKSDGKNSDDINFTLKRQRQNYLALKLQG